MYTDYVYPAFVTLLADISCLLFLFRKCLFVVVVIVSFSLSSLPPYVFRFYLWLIGQFVTAVSLPDSGSHSEFLCSSAFVYIPMLCHR